MAEDLPSLGKLPYSLIILQTKDCIQYRYFSHQQVTPFTADMPSRIPLIIVRTPFIPLFQSLI